MLKVFANPLDNLKEKNGVFKCRLCVQTFNDQETAINHIKTEHEKDNAKDLFEENDTGSDASVNDGSSSEDDGSSGDEESEVHTNSEEDSDNLMKTNNNSRKRAPRPLQVTQLTHDSHELTHVRFAISKVVGDLRKLQKISTVTFKWTSES